MTGKLGSLRHWKIVRLQKKLSVSLGHLPKYCGSEEPLMRNSFPFVSFTEADRAPAHFTEIVVGLFLMPDLHFHSHSHSVTSL